MRQNMLDNKNKNHLEDSLETHDLKPNNEPTNKVQFINFKKELSLPTNLVDKMYSLQYQPRNNNYK